MEELKKLLNEYGKAFEEFKAANDRRIAAIESKGYAPADLVEKVERINADLSEKKKQIDAVEDSISRAKFPAGG